MPSLTVWTRNSILNEKVNAVLAGAKRAGIKADVRFRSEITGPEAFDSVDYHVCALHMPYLPPCDRRLILELPMWRGLSAWDGAGGRDARGITPYMQLSPRNLNWLNPVGCAVRARRLGLVQQPIAQAGKYLLVLGQVPNDTQHGLDAVALEDYYAKLMRKPNAMFRAHPKTPEWGSQFRRIAGTLHHCLIKSHTVATYNSTAALFAFIAGRPVICHPSAFYAAYADGGPTDELLARVANSIWTPAEVANTNLIPQLLEHLK